MIEGIKRFGLNEYESRAYKSLLDSGRGSAVFVSKRAGIPRARVYDVLSSLEKKGFVVRSVSKPVEFSPVTPSKAFEAVSAREKELLEARLDGLKGVVGSLEKNLSFGENLGMESAWIVEGRHNIYSRIAEQLENCKDTVLISSSDEGLKRKKSFFDEKLGRLAKRGVKVVSVRRPDARFIVFDKESVMMFLNPESVGDSQEKALLVKSPFVAGFFHSGLKK